MRLALLLLFFSSAALFADTPVVLPSPSSITVQEGHYSFTQETRIVYIDRRAPRAIETTLLPLAEVFAEELELITGLKPEVVNLSETKIQTGDILLRFSKSEKAFAENETLETHSYSLKVRPKGVLIEAPYYKGVAHGTASFLQLLKEENSEFRTPAAFIEDVPETEYRSVMIDVARNVHSIGVLKDVIRLARLYKLRYVHLHLTDDQNFTFPFEPVVSSLDGNFSYSRQDLIDLVAYADARGITLIPELDLPGHSSKLRASGYLDPSKNDADVADPANTEKITAIIDDMLSIFTSSPYFHIGGDESGAGHKLIPFLSKINSHLREKPENQKKRLIVWEGFHGAPRDLPAKGDDRIIVMAWESSYNAPWDLLKNNYQIINSSWKPTYLAGGGGLIHAGNTGGRKFTYQDLFRWSKTRFMHWEPGRPIYNDAGPRDKNKDDGEWDAAWIRKEKLVLGGQLQFWEQKESAVIERLHKRLAIAAQRLWSPSNSITFESFMKQLPDAHERIMTIVQPIKVVFPPLEIENHPITDVYYPYSGNSVLFTLINRTKIPGTIFFEETPLVSGSGLIGYHPMPAPTPSSQKYRGKFKKAGGFAIRAALFRGDGSQVEGNTWTRFNNWPNKVKVTDYDIGRKTPKKVIDLAALPKEKIKRSYHMPMLRGPLQHIEIKGQSHVALLTVPKTGEFRISLKSQHGTASMYLDLNGDQKWGKDEIIIANTPSSEKMITKSVELTAKKPVLMRIDHMTGMPRPVLGASIEGPGIPKRADITPFLSLPKN